MTTLKSCSIDDQYKHVSFKDLEGYLRKDDYLSGYCEAEKELVRQNLGIETYKVDSKLSDLSTNPVENQAVSNALKSKADIDKLPKVALTGNYCDLIHKPVYMPNPEYLIIVDQNGSVGYNGEAPVKVKIPTHLSELTNDAGYLTQETIDDGAYVKAIQMNGYDSSLILPERGVITLNIDEYTGIDHELSTTSVRPVQNKVITRALKSILQKLVRKLTDLCDVNAENPKNGQLLAYVKSGDECKGYWEPVGEPKNAGDILVFNGTSWEIQNLNDLISKPCLWKVNNNAELVPDKDEILRQYSNIINNYEEKIAIATDGAIFSGKTI